MTTDKFLTYRGDVKALVGVGSIVAFVTVHSEGQPTPVYLLDADKLILTAENLPAGGVSIVAEGETLFIGGSDSQLYRSSVRGGTPKPVGPKLLGLPVALALLSNDRLGVLSANQLLILHRGDGRTLQTLELADSGTALAADPTGNWLVAGTAQGTVAVYTSEDQTEFTLSESDTLHQGAVTSLLFEPEELRFLSAGADGKLLSTLARGKLEPEDRGRGNNHTEPITSMVRGPYDRFLTGSLDKSLKSWPRGPGARPATMKDGVGKVVGLTLVKIHTKTIAIVVCVGNTLRFFPIDEEGKFEERSVRVYGMLGWAKNELADGDPRRRENALKTLAKNDDAASVELLAESIGKDGDHILRRTAAELLGASGHPRAAKLLEPFINHADEAVRVAVFQGLRKQFGEQDLRPLELALKTEKADVGKLAVEGLEALAKRDETALEKLTEVLNANTLDVRQAALASLERLHDPQSPDANLLALNSRHPDLRRWTLIRLFQRGMLNLPPVQAALRWRGEDADRDVRRTAFLLSLHTRERLVKALRERDPELDRQLLEVEYFGKDAPPEKKKDPTPPKEKPTLDAVELEPLLQATASRALDTCLRGGCALALLGDARAFGLLLQLSREEAVEARVAVCRALGTMDDSRSVNRLRSMLYDPDAQVRDAAFSALTQTRSIAPLTNAESGLNSAFEDVRQRGLQLLLSVMRKAPAARGDEPPEAMLAKALNNPEWRLLARALNDSFPAVRNEAFKACLNLNVAGGGVRTYRFILQSIHADVRREVLTEAMAQSGETWAWNLLLEFYNDRDPVLRAEAFNYAVRKTKELRPLEAALSSEYADVRTMGVEGLIQKRTKAAQELLVKAVTDRDEMVRLQALQALIDADAKAVLFEAMKSPHGDVRVRAACALARHGEAAALQPLLVLASTPEPEKAEAQAQLNWLTQLLQALAGLADLGVSHAIGDLTPLLDSSHAGVRKDAARALLWSALPNHLEVLQHALQHSDPNVKYLAALGLAYGGDPVVASLVFSKSAAEVLTSTERLVAALTLGPAGEDQLVVFLDDADEKVRNQAMLLLMLTELKASQPTPTRCLACLSSRMPRVRLTAARGLETFSDPEAFGKFVVELFNDRGEEQPWKVPASTVETLADLVTHGPPQVRARSALLLQHLSEKEANAFNQAWTAHEARYKPEINALRREKRERPQPPPEYAPDQLRELAFGAYVGLVREQGSSRGGSVPAFQIVRVRQTALNRILTLAADPRYATAAQPVLVQALADPNQVVRTQAFEQLKKLGMDSTRLGSEAMGAGFTDLGQKGLELLQESAGGVEGQKVLERVLLTRNDPLANEAARLLGTQRGVVPIATMALEAAFAPLRQQAVQLLMQEYPKNEEARKQVRKALQSRYAVVRETAAIRLGEQKDLAAFDTLVQLLKSDDAAKQSSVMNALKQLGDSRAADAFLDRVENDPAKTALAEELITSAATFRRIETADRLLRMLEKNIGPRMAVFNALLTVSGFDQRVDDPEDERLDKTWEQKQHPRHDALLARLMGVCLAIPELRSNLARCIPGARWSRGKQVEPVLVQIAGLADDRLRQQAMESLAWRLRKREGSPEPLVRALQHKDAMTQFLAAEGLARARRPEGITVLMSSVEFLSDLTLRKRAVAALGELGDLRALELLLKYANDPTQPLQQEASEALGHMGRSPQADEITKLLERYARGYDRLALNALKGLRWLDTTAAWQLIRKRAVDVGFSFRSAVVELLGANDEPATRDLLLKLLADDRTPGVVQSALIAARKLWPEDSLEPDYALLKNATAGKGEHVTFCLERVTQRGEPRRIFEVLPRCTDALHTTLGNNLLARSPLPLQEARAALGGSEPRTVQLAAQILGRAGKEAAKAGGDLETALKSWHQTWIEKRTKLLREGQRDSTFDRITSCLRTLVWAAGRLNAAGAELTALAGARPEDREFRPVRLQAVMAAADAKAVGPLETAAVSADPEVRTFAADALADADGKRAATAAEKMLSDRITFQRLVSAPGVEVSTLVRQASEKVHYQGVALPQLVLKGDFVGLSAVATNRALPEATRLGAVEGLARMAREDAEAKLVEIGTSDAEEELRKAAWRGLRRSKRARAR